MHFHEITIVITLLLAILSNSLFSFGYIVACLYMMHETAKFFTKEQKEYKINGLLIFFLRPYVFLDFTLQIIYQIPIKNMHANQSNKTSWQSIIGFYQIWNIPDGQTVNNLDPGEVNTANVVYILLKAFTYFLVSLQIQIFNAKTYKEKFVKKDLEKFLDQAQTKGLCITYKFNNYKLQKLAEKQHNKKEMENSLVELKRKLKNWQKLYYNTELSQQ